MARPKPSAQGELLTHRDEFHNHNHCIKYHRLITIVLQCRQLKKRSTITSGNYGYGGGAETARRALHPVPPATAAAVPVCTRIEKIDPPKKAA